jgi:hypothetical protein
MPNYAHELTEARESLGRAWLRGEVSLAEGIRRKTEWLETAFARADEQTRTLRAELVRALAERDEARCDLTAERDVSLGVVEAARAWVSADDSRDVRALGRAERGLRTAVEAFEAWEQSVREAGRMK